ncbi:hypothetical protein EAI_00375 [Harpegnathos saltator]|uniref:Transmembrane protein n=1 Tax=Harpegnathos saltator TaxID=610380 RepID=E2BA30_HARSA|nr:hypothetical protein EAI_00375 [Harpegnathos saltator]
MSKEESSGEPQQDAAAAASDAPSKDPNAEIYENRGTKKIVRVVTVMAYLFSVSFVGILLSAYYIFLWEPPNPRLIERERLRAEPQMQFLIAQPYLEEAEHPREKESFLLENVPNRTFKSRPLQGRIAHEPGVLAGPVSPGDLMASRQERLDAMLLKLKYSLMETLREARRNRTSRLPQEATTSEPDGLFFGAKAAEKSTEDATSGYAEERVSPQGNAPVEKTRVDGDGAGLSQESPDSSSVDPLLSRTAISDDEPKQTRRSEEAVGGVNPPVVGGETRDPAEERPTSSWR